jgi:NADH-quinone oxidoreductase subunit J
VIATVTVPDLLIFISATALMVLGAGGVVVFKNPVHSALSLIVTFFGVALAFAVQQAHFLAAVEIIVYAGAIVVLFLFVIMFLGVDRDDDVTMEPIVGQRPLAALGVVVTVVGLTVTIGHAGWVSGAKSATTGGTPTTGGADNTAELGRSIFTSYLYAFEITAALLIIAVVGAVLLVRRERLVEIENTASELPASENVEPGTTDADVEAP